MFDYSPFWETLDKKKLKAYTLEKKMNVSTSTLSRIRNGKNLNIKTIDDLCTLLNCDISDIVRHIPDDKDSKDS